jgi:hypothetical protein
MRKFWLDNARDQNVGVMSFYFIVGNLNAGDFRAGGFMRVEGLN